MSEESTFNQRLHADRSIIDGIITQLGLTWNVFDRIERDGRTILPRNEPLPANRRAVYVEARKVLSFDRIARATGVKRQTIITSYREARRAGIPRSDGGRED